MNNNPFVLPGFGQTGAMGQNPILASMEMMRQAWEGLASSGGMDPAAMGRMMSVEEMDKRIADLRAVENWLRMNLSMLSSTIQGLEVQRATVSTLKSFVDTGMASVTQPPAAGAPAAETRTRPAASLDEVLGLKPAAPTEAAAEAPGPAAGAPDAAAPGASEDQADILAAAASATQGWWNMLQQQFQNLATATAASAEGALADFAEAGKAVADSQAAAQAAATGKPPAARKTAARAAGKSAAKTAAKKTPAKKTAAKKTAARTASKTAAKTARKKTS